MRKHRIILIIITCVMCLFRFDYIYRDSIQYIWYVDFFTGGNISLIPDGKFLDDFVVRAPFMYRPLLPFLVALISGGNNISFMFSILNVVFLCILSNWIYDIMDLVAKNKNRAFIGALVTTVSYPLIFYGPVPLADATMMLLFVFIIMCAEFNYGDEAAAFVLLIGVFVKEAILFLGLYYVIRLGWKRIWIMIPAILGYLGLRLWLGSRNTLIFNLNILERMDVILLMFAATFAIPIIYIVYYYLRGERITQRGKKILIAGLLACLPLLILGLFFSYFDGRFIWPMLIVLGIYISSMRK